MRLTLIFITLSLFCFAGFAAEQKGTNANATHAWMQDNSGKYWPSEVVYTTDGNGNVIPISGGGGGGGGGTVVQGAPNAGGSNSWWVQQYGTWNFNLPTGASTSVLQNQIDTDLLSFKSSNHTDLTYLGTLLGSPMQNSGGSVTAYVQGGNATAVKVDGSSVTQPVSASSLPLPSNAAQETGGNLAAIAASIPMQQSTIQLGGASAQPVRPVPQTIWRTTFAQVLASGVDSSFFNTIQTGTSQTVSQSAGNLVLAANTTANSETILRSVQSFKDNIILKYQMLLSQRIVNNNFYVELVDVIGDGLATTVNSATSITVTIPNNPFTSANVGQSMFIGAVQNISATAVPGRYSIASVSGNNVTFTVAGWPASGSGTVSLFGWNYHQVVYNGTTATNDFYDAQRRGWNSGYTTATINTTASPGHMGIIAQEDGVGAYLDQLVASSTLLQPTVRANRVIDLPDESVPLYVQIRSLNGSTAPASTTSATIGTLSVENYAPQAVTIHNSKVQGVSSALPVQISNTPSVVVSSGTVTTVSSVTSVAADNLSANAAVNDLASVAKTATFTLAITPAAGQGQSYSFELAATAVTGTNPTMDCQILETYDNAATYPKVVYQFERVTATLATPLVSPMIRMNGNRFEYSCTIGGTSPSFTMALWRVANAANSATHKQLYDRAMVPTTASSPGTTWNTDDCQQGKLIYYQSAVTTSPVLTYQESADASVWANTSYTLTPTSAAGAYSIPLTQMGAKYGRIITTTAGTGVTYGYTALSCTGP